VKIKGTIGDFRLEDYGWSENSFFARERHSGRRFVVVQVEPEADLSDPEHRRWFRQMQMLLRSFEHPNIVVPKLFMREGKYYIAREFVEGTPLNEVQDLESGQMLRLMNSVADGVTAARRLGVAHGAIKGNKIIVTANKHPKLIGLGEREIISVSRGLGYSSKEEAASMDDNFIQQVQVGEVNAILHVLESKRPAPLKATEDSHTTEAHAVRFVNTWFDAEELPIKVQQSCWFKFNIGPRTEQAARATPFKEPDFGSHPFVGLIITLFSDDFAIDRDWFQFDLQKTGSTETFGTRVTAARAGSDCVIRMHILLAREKQTLQVLTVTTEVADRSRAQTLAMAGAD
jgi:hypothetical protein